MNDTRSESGDSERTVDIESSDSHCADKSTPSNNDVDQTTTGSSQQKTSSFGRLIKQPK